MEKIETGIFDTLPPPADNLSTEIQGVWWLLSREERGEDGQRKIEPMLGSDPYGILTYTRDHFAAQFMRRDRNNDSDTPMIHQQHNNTSAVDGYDAYFGTYVVDETKGKAVHKLVGSINRYNVGMIVLRDLRVIDGQLIVQLQTTGADCKPVTRRLTWKRIS